MSSHHSNYFKVNFLIEMNWAISWTVGPVLWTYIYYKCIESTVYTYIIV